MGHEDDTERAFIELRVLLEHLQKQADKNGAKLDDIEEKLVDARIAIGKLETKNGVIASILGAFSGAVGAALKIKSGQ
jgi:hypothetical protein